MAGIKLSYLYGIMYLLGAVGLYSCPNSEAGGEDEIFLGNAGSRNCPSRYGYIQSLISNLTSA